MITIKNGGFSLIEVLISIFVLSIGVLCATAMQLTALRTVQESGFKTTALQLAVEMSNQIRASNIQIKLEDSQNPYLSVNYKSDIDPEIPNLLCFSAGANCMANDLAKFNIYDWEKRIKATLPKGRVLICKDAEPWDSVSSEYKWECRGSNDAKSQVVIKLGWYRKNSDGNAEHDDMENTPPVIAMIVGI